MLTFLLISDRGSWEFCGGTGTANPSTGRKKIENIVAKYIVPHLQPNKNNNKKKTV